jgi:hypothetical protein
VKRHDPSTTRQMQNHVESVAQIIQSFTHLREAELLLPANEPLDSPLRVVIAEQRGRLRKNLLARIVQSLFALRHTETTLPDDEPENSPLRNMIAEQTERLRAHLTRFAGTDALAQFDTEQAGAV